MTFEEADKVLHVWGRYLEYCSKIVMIFTNHIPESFLPYPKDTLFEAFNIMDSYYQKTGNKRGVVIIKETAFLLTCYIDDEKALLETAKNFNDPRFREAFLTSLKDLQKEWIKTQK